MSSLFDSTPPPPLAEALRPKTIEQVIGQTHLLASGKPLNLAFASGKPHSMILWGPPGVGKTTLARLSAKAFDREFIAISAVLAGVKEIREAIEQAQQSMENKPSYLWMKFIALIKVSKMPYCLMLSQACLPLLGPRPRILHLK